MIHGTIHGITREPFPGGMEWKGVEWISLLHASLLTEGTLPRRPASLAGPMQDKP